MRAELLDRGDIVEAMVTYDDLREADRVWLINSRAGVGRDRDRPRLGAGATRRGQRLPKLSGQPVEPRGTQRQLRP